ncbi:MAG: discoidin domain-containing protein [Deltaproteobacteria bacterium]|nr:discoidin domain-containing protein [Deltaproteobacteria bacterium]
MSTPQTLSRWLWPTTVEDDGPAALWRERAWRWTVLLLTLGFAFVGARELRLALRPELARHAPWRISSAVGEAPTAARGFDTTSEGLPNIFFQTQSEPAPWIEFDLGSPRDITLVRVVNRLDCCRDWANPLVVEASDDRLRWRQLARREEPFDTWRAVFPETRARYVRLRVPRPTQLNLSWVEIR